MTADVIVSGEIGAAIYYNLEQDLDVCFQHNTQGCTGGYRQSKKNFKWYADFKGIKKILTSDNGIVYVENSKEVTINQFRRFAKCKINIQASQISLRW